MDTAKRVTVYGTAILTGLAVLGVIWSVAVSLTITPAMERLISEERKARAVADSIQAERMADVTISQVRLSRDRVLIIRVLEARTRMERDARVDVLREIWRKEGDGPFREDGP